MRPTAILMLLLIGHLSFSQTINGMQLMDAETYQLLFANEKDPCAVSEIYKDKSQERNDSTIYYLHIAEQLSQKCDDLDARTFVRFDLAETFAATGNHEMALKYLNLALTDFSLIQDTIYVAKTYKAIGVNYKRTSKYIEALNAYNAAAHYFCLADDSTGIAAIELNIGTILKSMNRYDQAKQKYHSALYRFQQLEVDESIADCQNNLGNVFKNEEN